MTDPAPFLICPPVDGPVTQEFGAMDSGYPHRGRDYGVPIGTPVVAGAPGQVVDFVNSWTEWNGQRVRSFGNAVCVRFDNGLYELLAHLDQAIVPLDAHVEARTVLGYSGNTGVSTGPHVHQQLCTTPSFPVDIAYSRDPRLFFVREGDPMTPAERVEFDALKGQVQVLSDLLVGNGFDAICRPGTEDLFPAGTVVVSDPNATGPLIRLAGAAAVEYARRRQFSFGLGLEKVQARS